MSSRTMQPPSTETLSSDRATLAALKDITSYAPRDPAHSTEALSDREAALARADAALARARLAYDAARVEFSREAWAFHDSAVAARAEVKVQFGPDSHEVHAVGLKRASERKRPARRATAPSA